VLDKTGTLTYGSLAVKDAQITPTMDAQSFWMHLAIAEKYSEHPIGRTAYREAAKRFERIPDADDVRVQKGLGIWAKHKTDEIIVGNERMLEASHIALPREDATRITRQIGESKMAGTAQHATWGGETRFYLAVNGTYAGSVTVADVPRPEAAESLRALDRIGVHRVLMFTGDVRETAAKIARTLGIVEFRAAMSPEDKLRELETLAHAGETVGMVGDGINDAPALARADVGIAMGGGGTAVAAEAADVVILTDDLSRVPEMILLGRKTVSVIRGDIAIWFVTNLFGFALVLTDIAGPALAAFYNFATDFLPILNSSRLFKQEKNARQR